MDVLIKTLLVGAITFVLWKLFSTFLEYKRLCNKLKTIPQKASHMLLGHGKEVKDSKTYMDYTIDVMKEGGRMYCVWNGPFPNVGVCHPDTFQQLNKQVSAKARGLADGYRILLPWLGDGLLISEGRKWERNRRLLTPAFHFDILSGYVKVMNDVTDVFLEKLENTLSNDEPLDVFPFVCRATLDSMLKCSLSYDGTMQDTEEHQYVKNVQRLTNLMWERMLSPLLLFDSIFNISPVGREQSRLVKSVHKFTGDIIQARKKLLEKEPDITKHKRRLDFLDILLTAKDDQGLTLTEQEIKDEVDTFTFEGHDTTASAISFAIYALGQHWDIQEKVYEDVQNTLGDSTELTQSDLSQFQYLPLFIKEVMRFYSPVPLVARKHTKAITIDGMEIPPGPRVDINIYAIHHNPQVWKSPEVFDPNRFDADHRLETDIYGFIPFSAGSRNCIGQIFALNEIKITLAKLVKRFQVLPAPDHKPQLQPDAVMRSSNGLPVILRHRKL